MHPVWTSLAITTLCISLVALAASLVSLWFGWRNHLRAEKQDRRRTPKLEIDLKHSRILPSPAGRLYCFYVQVRNPTDTDNAISLIELRTVFRMATGTEVIAKISQVEPAAFPKELGGPLAVPAKVSAHNIITGWCVFDLLTDVIGNKFIESYEVEFHDTHGVVSKLEPRIVQRPNSDLS